MSNFKDITSSVQVIGCIFNNPKILDMTETYFFAEEDFVDEPIKEDPNARKRRSTKESRENAANEAENVENEIKKNKEEHYREVEGYSEYELLKFVQNQNVKAWMVMLIWLCFNAVWGFLYLFGVIDNADLLMITVFYFLCDYICILFFCPFQTYIMKNKCCVNCRIYDWGHFMMFTPMLFIKNFFSWSLFFTSLVVLIHWENVYAKYTQRFWSESNQTLQCNHCKDKTCQMKKALSGRTNAKA